MSRSEPRLQPRLGYVLKMYPRHSETFVVSEILAREANGADIEIFSLRPPADGRFHEMLAAVHAPVTYLRHAGRHAVDLWELLRGGQAQLPGFTAALPELLAADAGDAAQALELAVHLRTRGITHLHAHFATVATTVARLASLLSLVPYSFTAHAKDIFHEDVDQDDLRRKLHGAHHVVTVSDYNLAYLRGRHAAVTDRLARVYNGLDLGAFPYDVPRRRPSLIAAVGRLVEKKGLGDLLTACALLAAEGREFRCVIAGTGALEQQLRQQVDELDLAGVVELAGPLSQARVRELIGGSAVLAAPSVVGRDGNQDGLPTVLLEAMALGTPCVSTPVTGIPEVLQDGLTGLLVPQHDPPALAAALGRLIDDAPLRVRLACAARARVEREFASDRQARQLAGLLEVDARHGDIVAGSAVAGSEVA